MRIAVAVLLSASIVAAQDAPKAADAKLPPIEKLKLPPGFQVSVFAYPVPNARSMALSPKGTLFVGSRGERSVYAVSDRDGDGRAESIATVARGLNSPNGVEFKDGALYVGEKTRIIRYDGIEDRLTNPPAPVVVSDGHPDGRQHGHKYMRFGPDGWLYFGVGAPCNICNKEEEEPRFASITRVSADGKTLEVFASGVRNTVGFDWHPQTKELWFTDNGRDMLTEDFDDKPHDELNHAPKKGMHFGYPFCHQGDLVNTGKEHAIGGRDQVIAAPADACEKYTPPVLKLGPHVAALGMKFYTGSMFPAEYHNAIFIAQHGSWNRTAKAGPTGYRVMVARPEAKAEADRYQPFIEGFLDADGTAWGRPADVLVMPDGSLLVSDDKLGAIYRVTTAGSRP